MKLAILGATGFVGTALVNEALRRGHQVTAIARRPEKLAAQQGLRLQATDLGDPATVAAAVAGHDAVLSAYSPGWGETDLYEKMVRGSQAILDGVRRSSVKRLLVVGGAGSLEVAPGLQFVDTPDFPAEYRQGALGARESLNQLRGVDDLDWSFLSPPALLEPGERSGRYRLGSDQLLMDGAQPARISVADLAVVVLDEIEKPQHIRRRFTAAY